MGLIDFSNKFSVGVIPMKNDIDTPINIFKDFFKRVSKYVGKYYFLAPIDKKGGAKQNGANIYSKLLENLLLLKKFNFKIQMQLFIHDYSDEQIAQLSRDLKEKDVHLDEISTISCYYQAVKTYFPEVKVIYDPYNRPINKEQILDTIDYYDGYVLDNPYNKDNDLIKTLKSKGKEVTILLNSGCVPSCPGCFTHGELSCPYNRADYYMDKPYSEDLSFAHESIMPYEIHNGWIDMAKVDYVALSPFYLDPIVSFGAISKYVLDDNKLDKGEWEAFHPSFPFDFKHLKAKNVLKEKQRIYGIK